MIAERPRARREPPTAPRPSDGVERVALRKEDVAGLVLRLRRAQGQLGAVAAMLEEGRGCREVVVQLAAAKKAIDRTGFALFEAAMAQCLADPSSSPTDQKAMQKLFLSLS